MKASRRRRAIRWLVAGVAAGSPAAALGARVEALRDTDRFAVALGVGVLLAGAGLVLAILREARSGERPEQAPARITHVPPENLSPAVAGALVAGDAAIVHPIACVFDLVARGHVQLELEEADRPQAPGSWSFKRPRTTAELQPFERALLDRMCPHPGGSVAAPAAWRSVHAHARTFRDALRAELQRSGDFDARALERRRGLYTLSGVAAVLGSGALAAAALVRMLGPAWAGPGIALLCVAAIALAGATQLSRHTPRGRRRADDWRAFVRYLRRCVARRSTLDAVTFERHFTYALAFGLAPAWMQAARRAQLDAPGWFASTRAAAAPLAPLAALAAQLAVSGAQPDRRPT